MKPAQTRRQMAMRGVSMIEILVVLVLFSFGLLGLVGLQARATQTSVSAEDTNRAALLADDLAAQMWAANTVSLPAANLTAWNTRLANAAALGLPGGAGTVTVSGNVATITISWQPPHQAAGDTRRYITEVVIP